MGKLPYVLTLSFVLNHSTQIHYTSRLEFHNPGYHLLADYQIRHARESVNSHAKVTIYVLNQPANTTAGEAQKYLRK